MDNLSKAIDCIGITTLNKSQINGIEDYVSQIDEHTFLSRNKIYYSEASFKKMSQYREVLYSRIKDSRITNYVLLDYIIQFSAQATYHALRYRLPCYEDCLQCMQEDVDNMVSVIESKEIHHTNNLPQSDDVIKVRQIESDNKLLLYAVAKQYVLDKDYLLITPGLGSILIGAFFKSVQGVDYKIINFSRYKQIKDNEFEKLKHLYDKIYVIDDSVGSGLTTKELREMLLPCDIKLSAIEFDWFIYDQICQNKSCYIKFDYKLYDQMTFFNVRNHQFLDKAIECLLHNPIEYIDYLRKNNFAKCDKLDLDIVYDIGKSLASKYLDTDTFNKTKIFSDKILQKYKEY